MITTDRDRDLRIADAEARALSRRTFDVPILLEAGAGTGKTTTLIARLVTWTLGPGWERATLDVATSDTAAIARTVLDGVIAVTFTEAAAAEMEKRLAEAYVVLASEKLPHDFESADLPCDAKTCARRARALSSGLDRPVVHTIHAFCRGLLAEHPFEARISPGFEIDADGSALSAIAREIVESEIAARLAGAPDAAIVQLLSRDAGAVRLHEALTKLASDGRDARDLAFDPYTPERAAALVDSLAASVRAFLGGPGARLAGLGARGKVTTRVLEELQCSLEALPDGRPVPLDALDAAADAVRRSWSAEARKRLVLWSKGEFNQGESKFLGEDEPRARDLAGPLASALDVFRCMRPRLHDSARRTLAELLTRVRAELLSQGIETYTDLLRDARRLVLENPRVVARIRARVRQIVVDEFQDTDPTQCDLIRRIALDDLPGTQKPGLFLVGDPKQSIYGWRSADLAAYESFADEIVRCGGLRERLSVNYRSTRRILDEVERAMLPIMIAEAGLQPSFEPLVAARDVDGVPVERVVPWCLDASAPQSLGDTTKSDSRAIEADWIARDLASQREQGTPWRKMAILLRATGDLDVYLSALRAHAVPYEVAGDKSFYQRREIIEASVLVRTIVDPRDHVALVALLRSSLVGVPDAALIPLWRQRFHEHVTEIDGPGHASLGAALQAIDAALPEVPRDVPGIERVAGFGASLIAAAHAIARLRRSLARDPADVFVEELRTQFLVEARSAALYLGPYRVSNLERFFRRLAEELDEEGADTQACLRALRAASSEGREAEEARPKDAALDAVQVLTIHKAKGLDFAHVYVADLHRSLPPSKLPNCDVVHGEDRTSYAFFGSATPGYEEALAERDRVASAERVRTLYVAMTRAKERLVLSGPLPLAAAPAWDKCKTHMELLAHSFSPDTYAELVAAHAAGERTRATNGNVWILPEAAPPPRRRDASTGAHEDVSDVEHAVASLGAARAVAATRMARPWSTSASASAEHVAMPKHESATVIDRDDATAIGRAFHRMLEVFVAPTDPEKLRIVLLRFLESEAATVPSAQAVLQATLLLDRFLAGALHEKLMKLGTDILARELPVIALPAADDAATAFVSGTIDLVYRDPASGEIVIADYKTDALPTSETAARYAAQGRAYQRAIRDALELDRDPRFELWFVAEDRIEVVS